ncbi:MAG: hypothetical protein M1147_08970 [Nitrospirae bacterium]|nr:hypothetical protein [Nitrospirota bacterium]MCL5978231.1 hypothetical protein [Nitrospirota bacterium]
MKYLTAFNVMISLFPYPEENRERNSEHILSKRYNFRTAVKDYRHP